MALIGKIREKSWLLVIVIGIAMLAFVVGDLDFLNNGPQADVYGIGTINNEKIDEDQYNTFLNNARNNIWQSKLRQNPTEQPVFTESDQKNALQQAWQTSVIVEIMNKEYEKLGLIVDEFEMENILYGENGYSPSAFSQQFVDSVSGEFDANQLRQYLNQIKESTNIDDVQQYNAVMNYVRQQQIENKYKTLLKSGIHATTLEGKKEYEAKETVKNVTYVFQSFARVPNDATEPPTDKEIQAYFELHKNEKKYKQKASRKIAYFEVPIFPSAEDTLKSLEFLSNLKPRFKTAKNDSIFVFRFSEVKMYANDSTRMAKPEGTAYQGSTYPVSVAKEVETAKIGDVIGPYISNGSAQLSKVIGFKEQETASVRHILLNATSPEQVEIAQKRADSIVKVIRTKHNFEEMVTKFSEDPGSVSTGGKYENFTRGTMVAEFNDFSFNKPIGTLGTVKTSYGIHIVEVLGHELTKYPIFATVVKNIEATKTTADEINSLASNYIYELDDLFENKTNEEKSKLFDSIAVNNNYTVRSVIINDESPSISGFSEIGEGRLLRLAYDSDAKTGKISSSPIHDRTRFVVAYIADIIEEGTPRLDLVKEQVIAEIKKEKQAQYLADKMVGKTDLESLSEELQAQIETEGLTFSASNVAIGNEPKIIGTAFSGLKDGETSIPVKGNNGVFVLRVDLTTTGKESSDYSAEIEQIKTEHKNFINNQFQSALMEAAEIVDNRKLRSFGIR